MIITLPYWKIITQNSTRDNESGLVALDLFYSSCYSIAVIFLLGMGADSYDFVNEYHKKDERLGHPRASCTYHFSDKSDKGRL